MKKITLPKDSLGEPLRQKSSKLSTQQPSTSASRKSSTANVKSASQTRTDLGEGLDEAERPKPVEDVQSLADFVKLAKIADEYIKRLPKQRHFSEYVPRRSSLGSVLKVNMDSVVQGINEALLILYEKPAEAPKESQPQDGLRESDVVVTPFIKVTLRQTEDILLYQQRSVTEVAGTPEAARVEKENKAYDYVTKGKGRLRRKADSEAQTKMVLYKSRDVNTDVLKRNEVGSFVSTSEMFDTYQKLQQVRSSLSLDDNSVLEVTTYKMGSQDPSEAIGASKNFNLCQMVTQRTLAGNVFREQQRRFRNMVTPDPLATKVDYLYSINVLWQLHPAFEAEKRRAACCMSFCPSNGDILAIGYGVFTCAPQFSPKGGHVLIWNIKNPVCPEKKMSYSVSVVSLEFSPYRPQLLAIGLYDGSVEVRDITTEGDCVVAVSQRESSPGYEPVLDIKWIGNDPGEVADIEPFLTVTQNGSVMKYRIINSPHLLGYTHAVLDRVEGSPEGLPVRRQSNILEAVRHPQCLGITLDPIKQDIFHVISNEGVIYKCSTNYPQQHLRLWQTHEGAAYSMEFSPWSPKLFLTCGDDWAIRIWIEGIFKPLVTLTNLLTPVNCAYWSKTHSTIIVAVNRKTVDVWDIRRSTLKPMSSTTLEKSNLTTAKFSNCGRSITVGNEKGMVYMCAFQDMPFPPTFQYEELEAAIFKALMPFPDLVTELKGIGYFGYPKEKRSII